ncbi:FAD:protein FMN transferase [Streptococcus sp. CSL10205-OR2]|uniref:FAD:protein FMN transferase n=1 Tax=Streptococcus sp. CSL10205-OR2 TaxID=2980558 RepID=UPI0021D8228B|nr:FAD:protein FMN transferase [Streptococcus sp. CSL10205-OR2]MCU9533416.1 FAD:protein FMN transferase [Streptococcus sp. CSL10205-OR2]
MIKQLSKRFKLMGTVIDLSITAINQSDVMKQSEKLLKEYEQRFNAHSSTSELTAINTNACHQPQQVHPDLFELISIGKTHSLAKDSGLNIALGGVIRLWRIGFQDAKKPSPDAIKKALTLTNPYQIVLDRTNQTVFLAQKGMALDLGALAKGYSTDKLKAFYQKNRVRSAVINLGGNVLLYGDNPNSADGYWRVGIRNPYHKKGVDSIVLSLKNQSVVTSGTYERQSMIDGKSYHHLINRQTGHPLKTDVVSLTIISKSSLDGEIWTSRLYGKTPKEILAIVDALEEMEVLILTTNKELYLSHSLKKKLIYQHPELKQKNS